MNKTNWLCVACGVILGMAIGFFAGYKKHETDSMRSINNWLEIQIKKHNDNNQFVR